MELPLCLDLYGVRFRIDQVANIDAATLARLFAPFVRPSDPTFDEAIPLEFCPRDRATDIVTLMNQGLSAAGMVVLHAGSLIGNDGLTVLLVGAGGSGKSTSVRRWLSIGGATSGDDLVLLTETGLGIEVRPYLWALQGIPEAGTGEKGIEFLDPPMMRGGVIRRVAFLEFSEGQTVIEPQKSAADELLRLSSQMLWSTDQMVSRRQRLLIERMLRLGNVRLKIGRDLLADAGILERCWSELI